MPLHVQIYLRSGKTLEDLYAEFRVKARPKPELGVVILNYDQFFSPMAEPICQECRALILEMGTWNVVSRSFFKFFNWNQPEAHPIDWSTARVQEKRDGSLICFYHYRGEWRVATKGNATASGPVNNNPEITFAELTRRTLEDMGTNWDAFTARLDPSLFYSFELTAPENRVIVPYAERRLTWLAAWDAQTLAEIDTRALPDLPAERIKSYAWDSLPTIEALCAQAEGMSALCDEGFVVVDAAFHRVKVKIPAYMMADRAISKLATNRRRVEAILSPDYDDIATILPDHVRAEMQEIEDIVHAFGDRVMAEFAAVRHLPTRKDFALAVQGSPHAPLLFGLLDGLTITDALRRVKPEALTRTLGLSDEEQDQEG